MAYDSKSTALSAEPSGRTEFKKPIIADYLIESPAYKIKYCVKKIRGKSIDYFV